VIVKGLTKKPYCSGAVSEARVRRKGKDLMVDDSIASAQRASGWDESTARIWVDKALRVEDVDFPWRLAVALAQEARPQTCLVVDAAAGPGGFLAAALDAFPDARGIWFDVSSTMREEAERHLGRFAGRVDFHIGDLAEIARVAPSGTVDLVVCSRATHHLPVPDLTRFYQQTAQLLAPDGWLANVDSMSDSPAWRQRLRTVRAQYRAAAGVPDVPTHPQLNVSPTMLEHLAALRASGFAEIELVWRVFVTGLVMARKIDPKEYLR
jgi:SAM-dependent methyltransferase